MNMTLRVVMLAILSTCIRVSHVSAQKPVEIVLPQTPFNAANAAEQLSGGSGQILGVAYYEGRTLVGIKSEQTVYAREGTVVTLYPVTPYLEEYLRLKQKNKEGKRMAAISPEAASYRIECKVLNDQGEFIFDGLKPGLYYLQTNVYFPSGIAAQEVSQVVEIKSEGERVKCNLNKIYRGFLY